MKDRSWLKVDKASPGKQRKKDVSSEARVPLGGTSSRPLISQASFRIRDLLSIRKAKVRALAVRDSIILSFMAGMSWLFLGLLPFLVIIVLFICVSCLHFFDYRRCEFGGLKFDEKTTRTTSTHSEPPFPSSSLRTFPATTTSTTSSVRASVSDDGEETESKVLTGSLSARRGFVSPEEGMGDTDLTSSVQKSLEGTLLLLLSICHSD